MKFRKKTDLPYGDLTNRLLAATIDVAIICLPVYFLTEIALGLFFAIPHQLEITQAKVIARAPETATDLFKMYQFTAENYPVELRLIIRQMIFAKSMQIILIGIYIIILDYKYGATLGKKAVGLKVVDVITHGKLTLSQSVIRFIGYFISILPLCLGLFYGGLRRDKRCWHDFFGDTVVIYDPNRWYKKYLQKFAVKFKTYFNIKH